MMFVTSSLWPYFSSFALRFSEKEESLSIQVFVKKFFESYFSSEDVGFWIFFCGFVPLSGADKTPKQQNSVQVITSGFSS